MAQPAGQFGCPMMPHSNYPLLNHQVPEWITNFADASSQKSWKGKSAVNTDKQKANLRVKSIVSRRCSYEPNSLIIILVFYHFLIVVVTVKSQLCWSSTHNFRSFPKFPKATSRCLHGMVHPDLLLLLPSLALPDDWQDGHPVGCGEVGPGRSGMVSCNAIVGEADPKSINRLSLLSSDFRVSFHVYVCIYIYIYNIIYIYVILYHINAYMDDERYYMATIQLQFVGWSSVLCHPILVKLGIGHQP